MFHNRESASSEPHHSWTCSAAPWSVLAKVASESRRRGPDHGGVIQRTERLKARLWVLKRRSSSPAFSPSPSPSRSTVFMSSMWTSKLPVPISGAEMEQLNSHSSDSRSDSSARECAGTSCPKMMFSDTDRMWSVCKHGGPNTESHIT